MLDISTIILTFNEEKHIARCIENARQFSKVIYLVDSFSTDRTKEIAESMGAIVYQNKWENNYARQLNWGLTNIPVSTQWVFRLDADEYLSPELIKELHTKVPTVAADITGLVMERKMVFLGKTINRGNIKWNMLRLFKYGEGTCEERWMDEHIVLRKGSSIQLEQCFFDDNLNPLGWWIVKHNGYSIREAIDLINIEIGFLPDNNHNITSEMAKDAEDKRHKKEKYARMPLFWRS
ncbi:glycosyltransferase family 2 protein, partial [Brucella sp. 21LCYQ03]|nr:glycosyltransferase family 2 protein [Brucella sp. 21LCYQ03]